MNELRHKPHTWEKLFVTYKFKSKNNSYKSVRKNKTKNTIIKWAKDINGQFTEN